MTVFKDMMFLFGGHDGAKQLDDFYYYHFVKELWVKIDYTGGVPPSPRDSHVIVTSGDSLFLFGGSTGMARNDFYEFDIEARTWNLVKKRGGDPPIAR